MTVQTRSAGPLGLLFDCETQAETLAVYAELTGRREGGRLPHVADIVPAQRSVLVVATADESGETCLARLRGERWAAATPRDSVSPGLGGDLVELPVHYDGPDLDEVARLAGARPAEIVEAHTSAELLVAFCGFSPGFGYLTGLPEALRVPRRAEPRTRVPAGAVGLAGEYTGVYPRESPGGWQLIGRLALPACRLWDPRRTPAALLEPGTRVRFRRADAGESDATAQAAQHPVERPLRDPGPTGVALLRTITAGALTTVQDAGRAGYAHLGVPRAGAADLVSLRLANRLVGNHADAAALETTVTGCAIELDHGRYVAVTGAPAEVTLDGRAVDQNAPIYVRAGQRLTLGRVRAGVRCYLAVAGGVAAPPVLGSRSTDTLGGLGPAPLRDGDELPIGEPRSLPPGVDTSRPLTVPDEVTLRVTLGPRTHYFTSAAVARLATSAYTVTAESNRVGLRLTGPELERAIPEELPSEGMVAGALQVPANGRPVLFLADHPVTGGYPVIGCVVPSDVPLAGQAAPGTRLRFHVVDQGVQ